MLLNSLAKEGLFGVVTFKLRPVQVQKAPRLMCAVFKEKEGIPSG